MVAALDKLHTVTGSMLMYMSTRPAEVPGAVLRAGVEIDERLPRMN